MCGLKNESNVPKLLLVLFEGSRHIIRLQVDIGYSGWLSCSLLRYRYIKLIVR